MKKKIENYLIFGFFALAAALVAYPTAAQKNRAITFDPLLTNQGSYVTNDFVYIDVVCSSSLITDENPDVITYLQPAGATNEWAELATHKLNSFPHTYSVIGATNYQYYVHLDFSPPPTVHTNGVYRINGFKIDASVNPYIAANPEVIRAGFANTTRRTIADISINNYIQDGLVAMWDAIEHGDDPLVWRDLTGNGWDFPADNITFGENYATISADVETPKTSLEFWEWDKATFEAVCERPYTTQNRNGFFRLGRLGIMHMNTSNSASYTWYANTAKNNWHALYTFLRGDITKRFSLASRAFVCDLNNANTDAQKVYYNGRLLTSDEIFAESWTETIPQTSRPMILYRGSTSIAPKFYNIRLYNRALTAEEVQHNYEIDRQRFNLP